MAQRLSLRNAALRFQDGGVVPGTGRGDKIPAKYEPGEFVVSNDMIDDNPGLREQLSSLRAETLAARGKTVEEADAKALRYHGGSQGGEHGQETRDEELQAAHARGRDLQRMDGQGDSVLLGRGGGTQGVRNVQVSLRAVDGFDPLDRVAKSLTGQNPLPPRSPVGSMAADLSRNARAAPPAVAPPAAPAGPGNPGMANPEARAAYSEMAKNAARPAPTAASPALTPTPTPAAPGAASKWLGSTEDWTRSLSPAADSPHKTLRMTAPGAPSKFGKGMLALQGAMGAKNAYDGIQEGDALKAGVGTADALAGAALFTPAAPAAGAYLGLRGAWDMGKAAGNWVNDKLSAETKDAIGGTINQIGQKTGLWGTSDDALMAQNAAPPPPAPGAAPAAKPDLRNPYANVTPEQGRAMAEVNAKAQQGQPQEQVMDGGIRRIDRPGQSPLYTNVADGGLLGNDNLMNRGAVSEQNLRALDAMDTRMRQESMGRVQAQAQAQAQAPGQPQAPRSKSWEERAAQWNDPFSGVGLARRNMEVSLGSMIPYHLRGKDGPGEKLKEAQAASLGEFAKQHFGMAPGDRADSTERYKSDQSLRASLANSDAARYGHDSSFAGTKYTADASLMGKRAEQQYKLRQQQMMGQLWQESGGDPMKFQGLAMQYGLPDAAKAGGEMARGTQTYQHNAANNARKRLEGMAVQRNDKGEEVVNPGRLAKLESSLAKMAPNYQHLSEPEQAKLLGKAEASVNLLEGLNSRQNTGFWQAIGIDGDKAELNNIPHEAMKGAKLTEVGLMEGATTGGGVSANDYAIKTEGGHTLHIPRATAGQGVLELLKELGVDISGARK